ncbi:uncharacterized protein LOC113207233 [Frankliniella occidentalis]|uniref:Uncharacterized protein LOC113207233 n=1 Tax=Frankliniella occidentalis TaxID=133901 RepID=A0A9C6X7X0_FRAOC|nr:uncharacterized protein LOC113207233 [Frankliniella occidentalis]
MSRSQEESGARLPPLCNHTECTADDVMLMCLTLGYRHNLTWVAVEGIMKMFNFVYGTKKINATKISLMKRLFDGTDNTKVAFHYYCQTCCKYASKVDSGCQQDLVCCGNKLDDTNKATYFATISFKDQLRNLFETNEQLAESALTYRFSRVKQNKDNLDDGADYKAHAKPGKILSFAHNFSYSFFTDGVGKSKKSFWPIYVTINELPPGDRKNNILIVGLYYGNGAPNLKTFLKPFVDEANKLSSSGFDWVHKGQVVNSKVIPLLCICDSDARYKLLNHQSHKAFYGCTYCYQKQTHTAKGLKYTLTTKKIVERTKESLHLDLLLASSNRNKGKKHRHGRGVLGVSSVAYLNFFNQSRGMPVDYMHNLLLGAMNTYFENLFMEKCKKFWVDKDATPEDLQKAIDERLLIIKPPTCIKPSPASSIL